jgi:hypothetical protein
VIAVRVLSLQLEIFWPLDQMQQIAFGVFKEQDASAARRRPNFFAELHAVFFQFGFGHVNRIYPQRNMAKTGKFVVAPIVRLAVSRVDLKPTAAGQGDEAGWRNLAVVPKLTRAQDANVPAFQSGGIRRGNGNVFNRDVHDLQLSHARRAGNPEFTFAI